MKTTFKNGKDEKVLDMEIGLQKNDRVVLDGWGIKQVIKVDKNVVILGKDET